jgi:hypothetical protein
MPIKLNGATSGSVELDVPDAIGSDLNLTIPATAGELVAKDASGNVSDLTVSGDVSVGDDLSFNSGYGSSAIAYGCRAYVRVNMSTSPGTIDGTKNVSSVTRIATGQYQVNFATSMPDANYAAFGVHNHWGGVTVNTTMSTTNQVATDIGILTTRCDNATAFNTSVLCIGVVR